MNLFLVVFLPLAAVEGSFDRTLRVDGPVSLEVVTGSGSIEVTRGATGTVEIHGEIRVGSGLFGGVGGSDRVRKIEENPPIEQAGNVIRVGSRSDEDLFRNVSISYRIVVPPETSLVSKSGSGSQTVGDIHGPVEAKTGSGSVTIGSIGDFVTAAAGSGSIRIDAAKGRLEAKTGSGSITALGVEGPVTARTGSGRIEIEQTGEGDVDVKAGSGSIQVGGVRGGLDVNSGSGTVRVAGELTGDWRIHASSGSITVELPDDAAFDLDAHTSSGSIELDHPVTVSGRLSRKEIRGAVRGGGHRLTVDSSSGSISIR
ncbi:MAG TPA: DUF4097 family beta strand repeat-containing protein [Vicinamibacteria bacterium]|nr:DUF4097 family beta strand repeat-containing protein [Vicinamibacteria bacterium]